MSLFEGDAMDAIKERLMRARQSVDLLLSLAFDLQDIVEPLRQKSPSDAKALVALFKKIEGTRATLESVRDDLTYRLDRFEQSTDPEAWMRRQEKEP